VSQVLLLEFAGSAELAHAARELRSRPGVELDAYTPYSTEEVREALALPPSRLPRLVFAAACLGAGGAYFIEWLTTAHLYPLNVGGRQQHMLLPFIPISFEMGVLLAALTAFIGVLVLGKLVVLWDPVFEVPGFESASVDRFWLRVSGPALDSVRAELDALKPLRQIVVEGHE
jgi:hypothetical protein